jgi:hypothetical protein
LRALSLCTCCRHYPGTATGGTTLLIRPVMSAFPERVAGSACASTFSRLTQRSLALRPAHSRCHQFVARLPEGFRHFVTSMPAPVASGWSGCRAGLAPAGKRRLFTAHTHSCRWAARYAGGKADVRVRSPTTLWGPGKKSVSGRSSCIVGSLGRVVSGFTSFTWVRLEGGSSVAGEPHVTCQSRLGSTPRSRP